MSEGNICMNITVVCDVLGEANNGTTIAALNLIRSMKERGHNVRVICSDQDRKEQDGFYIVPTRDLGPMINQYLKKNGVSLSRPVTKTVAEAIDGADVVHFMTSRSDPRKARHGRRRGLHDRLQRDAAHPRLRQREGEYVKVKRTGTAE